ncbi:glycosyltransferase family 9 protein [Aliikangiella sp. IMCC44632]
MSKKLPQTKIDQPKSICILRLSAIGDVCHAVASVQAIQKRWPQVKITWIIGKVELMLVDGLSGVEFIVFDKKAGLRGYLDLAKRLQGREFDILLHMQVALRASLATLCIRAKEKWGFDSARAKEGQWLFTNRQVMPQKSAHVAEGFLAFAQAVGVDAQYQLSWNMPIEKSTLEWFKQQVSLTSPYFVIAPAASKAQRNWLPESYAAIAQMARDRGMQVVICGGPTDMEKKLAADIIQNVQSDCINLVGKTTLKQLLVVIKNAHLVLAPDTGPAHMAVTVNTPVIGLYAHSNPRRTGPYLYSRFTVSVYDSLVKQQFNKNWQALPWGKRVKGENLMTLISVAQVESTFNAVLAEFPLP